jgi:hypothetical protein
MKTVLTNRAVPTGVATWVENLNASVIGKQEVVVGSLHVVEGHTMVWLLLERQPTGTSVTTETDGWLVCEHFMRDHANVLPSINTSLRCPYVDGLVATTIARIRQDLETGPNPTVDLIRRVEGQVPDWLQALRVMSLVHRRQFIGQLVGPQISYGLLAQIAFGGSDSAARTAVESLFEPKLAYERGDAPEGFFIGLAFSEHVPENL